MNEYLTEHKRAKVSVSKKKAEKLVEKLKLTGFASLGGRLLKLADVTLPSVLPCRNINVATRKKLPEQRKRLKNQMVKP